MKMDLVFGGAYQGKTAYAKEKYGFSEKDFFVCEGKTIDFEKPCVSHLERFTLACAEEGLDAVACLESCRNQWADTVFLCADMSCGVVPMDKLQRLWRSETGRVCQYLSRNAAHVVRIICGLEQKLK